MLAPGRVSIQMCHVSAFMCAHVCVSRYKCVFAFIYISKSVCLDICVYVSVCLRKYVSICLSPPPSLLHSPCACACTFTCMHLYLYEHPCVSVYLVCVCMCMCLYVCVSLCLLTHTTCNMLHTLLHIKVSDLKTKNFCHSNIFKMYTHFYFVISSLGILYSVHITSFPSFFQFHPSFFPTQCCILLKLASTIWAAHIFLNVGSSPGARSTFQGSHS